MTVRRAFVLIEVMVALVILAVAMTAILKGFVTVLATIRENTTATRAALLAETLMDDFELEPPVEGEADGSFADDIRFGEEYAAYFWEFEVEEVEIKYDGFPSNPLQEQEPLYEMTLRIIYDDKQYRRFVPVTVTTYLLDSEVFSREAMQSSQLF